MALVELCIIGDDAATADCISTIYAEEEDVYTAGDRDMPNCDEDSDAECMLDSMWDAWSDGLPTNGLADEEEDAKVNGDEAAKNKKVAQPWSSRSSPSGTYVRDPKTGKMVNIDE